MNQAKTPGITGGVRNDVIRISIIMNGKNSAVGPALLIHLQASRWSYNDPCHRAAL